jgi:hypothetical protein
MKRTNEWSCVQCGHTLGYVFGSEFHPRDDLPGKNLQTRGPNLMVICDNCEGKKIWYTADPIVRAIYQLVDSIVTVSAGKMVRAVSDEIRKTEKD